MPPSKVLHPCGHLAAAWNDRFHLCTICAEDYELYKQGKAFGWTDRFIDAMLQAREEGRLRREGDPSQASDDA